MHGRRFDDLARTLASGASRRLVVKGLAGAAAGGLLTGLGLDRVFGRQTDAQDCADVGAACVRDEVCCSGLCDQETRRCACGDGAEECDGACVDVSTDPENCGACGEGCDLDQRCLDGACCAAAGGPCAGEDECCGELTCCDERCTDPDSDPDNCGGCGQTCPYDPYLCEAPTCEVGACGLRPVPDGGACVSDDLTYACCAGGCADLYREEHCGACGNACAGGETCCRGEGCYDLQADAQHCGGCFHECDPGESCRAGACCPGPGTPCSGAEECCEGDLCCRGRCVAARTDPHHCGGCDTACLPGLVCLDSACAEPNAAGSTVEPGTGGAGPGELRQDGPPTGRGATIGGLCGGGITCGPGAGCCGGVCADFSRDPLHCGGCSRSCGPGGVCSMGVCLAGGVDSAGLLPPGCGDGPACGSGRSCCGGACVNPATDSANCGACGLACGAGETCCNGGCVGFTSCPAEAPLDLATCACRCADGRPPCGAACCVLSESCINGACALVDSLPPCGEDAPCESGYECCDGACADTMRDRASCGDCGAVCAESKECCEGRCVSLLTGANCGACGVACPPGACCRNGECVCSDGNPPCDGMCRDFTSDPMYCGACDTACAEGETCVIGECQPPGDGCADDQGCPEGYGCCGGACYDLRIDPLRCGGCEAICEADPAICRIPTCEDGTCGQTQAPDGYECREDDPYYRCCGGACVSLQTDPYHCGACGYACDPGHTCCGGEGCYDLQSDPLHCGGCDNACLTSETCLGGACVPFGDAGTGCDEENVCADGLTCCDGACRDTRSEQDHCGECGAVCANLQPPCAGVRATTGTAALYPPSDRAACVEGDQYYVCCESACTDVLGDPGNCGECGYGCAEGQECILGVCTGACADDGGCATGQACCEGTCRDIQSDPAHCGACGEVCQNTPEEGDELCCAGVCTPVDAQNCGVCGGACLDVGETCEPSETTATGYRCCTDAGRSCDPSQSTACCGDSTCVPIETGAYVCCWPDGEICQLACGVEAPCPRCCSGYCGADGVGCAPSASTCPDGRPPCDSTCCADGLRCCGDTCVDTLTDPGYCGACETACQPPADPFLCLSATCVNGVCADAPAEDGTLCVEGDETFACCGGVCTDLLNTPAHCGACGVVCSAEETCCRVPFGWGCYDPQTDPAHCGDCGLACPEGQGCVAGACAEVTDRCALPPVDCDAERRCGGEVDATCIDGVCLPPCTEAPDSCCPTEGCWALTYDLAVTHGLDLDDELAVCAPRCEIDGDCGPDAVCCPAFCADTPDADGLPGPCGVCANLLTNPLHCGQCGTACLENEGVCIDGVCPTFEEPICVEGGDPCDGDDVCCAGFRCDVVSELCVPDNGEQLCTDDDLSACPPDSFCCVGQCCTGIKICDDGHCCAVNNRPCEDDLDCCFGNICTDGLCQSPALAACAEGVGCPDGYVCNVDVCCLPPGSEAGFFAECCPGDISGGGGWEGDHCCVYLRDACATEGNCCQGEGVCDNGRCCGREGTVCSGIDELCCSGYRCDDAGIFCEPMPDEPECSGDGDCGDRFCCDGECIDPTTSREHCGACGLACPDRLPCVDGLCCHAAAEPCDDGGDYPCCPGYACVDGACAPCVDGVCPPDLDPCAAVLCEAGTFCCNGECADLSTALEHCGGCDNPCLDGEECADGQCRPRTDGECIAVAEECNTAETPCCPPYVCEGRRCCGGPSVACDGDDECCQGYACEEGECIRGDETNGALVSCAEEECRDGYECCEDVCYDTETDPNHCGGCLNVCGRTDVCVAGRCVPDDQVDGQVPACDEEGVCPEGQTCCAGSCVDTENDPYNCGGCYARCPVGECEAPTCSAGICDAEPAREGGACDVGGCIPGGACENGACVGEAAAEGTVCHDGNPCRLSGACTADGRCDQPAAPDGAGCEADNPCLVDGACVNGYCIGEYAVRSCETAGCSNGGECRYGLCVGNQRSPDGRACDDYNPCTQNGACRDGVCRGEPVVCVGNGCQTGYCDPSQGGCVAAAAALDLTICAADVDGFCCAGACCEAQLGYDTCTAAGCCYTESASPDGQVCCDIGDPSQGRGIGEYWVDGYGCCRIHLACNGICCPGLIENGEADEYCYEGNCREATLPCDQGCAGDEVCVGDACCPGWRACGDICCAQNEHCENGVCAPGYPRIPMTA